LVAGWYWLAPLLVVYGWLYYDLILFRGDPKVCAKYRRSQKATQLRGAGWLVAGMLYI
jgi:hypothetical protein